MARPLSADKDRRHVMCQFDFKYGNWLFKEFKFVVNWVTAVCEYTCIASIVVFYLTQVEDFK